MNIKQKALLKQLGEAVKKVTFLDYYLHEDRLFFDGPYEIAYCICGGSSVYSGEYGDYDTVLETDINKIVEKILFAGFYLEPYNGCELGIF